MPFVYHRNNVDVKAFDKERNITLTKMWMAPSGFSLFEISWHGKIIRLEAMVDGKSIEPDPANPQKKRDFSAIVWAIEVPPEFPEQRDVICRVVEEALPVLHDISGTTRNFSTDFKDGAFSRKVHWERRV